MENCWEQPPHGSQDYYPHYNLFQSSIFYDTDNFRVSYLSYRYEDCEATESGTRCCESQERSAEPPDKPAEAAAAAPAPGAPEPRVITKEELYSDPDLFQSKNEDVQPVATPSGPPMLAESRRWGYDWTKQSWVKAGRGAVVMRQKGERKEELRSKNKLYKQLADAPRVSISKAENMMQKMGWQGGALGKAGDGILDPITPEPPCALAASRTPAPKRGGRRDALRTNTLLHILEFVQDDTQIELFFDEALRQHERRFLHNLVHNVINARNVGGLGTVAQFGLVADIGRRNQYELATASEGEPPHRQMSVYKEAPEHVYLVTPDDLEPKDETEPASKENEENTGKNTETKDTKEETNGMDMDDDENPFLKSIKKSIKKDEEPKSISNKFEKDCNIALTEPDKTEESDPVTFEGKMLEFFLEFSEAKEYTEMRFLGKFNEDMMAAVNEILNDVAACAEDLDAFEGRREVAEAFRSGKCFELRDGPNGTAEIHKVPSPRT